MATFDVVEDPTLFGDDCRKLAALPHATAPGAELPHGLVPVAVSFAQRRIRLLDLRGVDCREQSFRQTVRRWIVDRPHANPIEMDWSAYVAAAGRTPPLVPAGFLFNVARCGSTLLANMLAAPDGHVVVKESSTIGGLLRQTLIASTEAERLELENLLAVTIPRFGQLADGATCLEGPRLFVKPHSLSTVSAATLLRLFPRTPALLLYREPGEVVASMLASAPYGNLYDQPREQMVDLFPALATLPPDLSPAAFYAHLWCSPVEAALALPADRLLLLDYADLAHRPVATIEQLVRHFGIDQSQQTAARMSSVSEVYAKDASGQVRFDAEGAHSRPALSAVLRAEVSMITADLYAQLQARRRSPSSPAS